MKTAYVPAFLLILVFIGGAAQPKTLTFMKEQSSIEYRLVHPLHKIEATSKDVDCRLDADVATKSIKKVIVVVDVTTFNSGNSNRDSHAMEVIDAISYPEARFVSTSIAQEGDSVTVHGDLSFHGVTHEVILKGVTQWSANDLLVQGSLETSLALFNIERPSLLMIPVGDELSFSFVAAFHWD